MPTVDPNNWKDRDEPLNVDLDPEDALRLLLAVDPNSDEADEEE